MEVVQVFETTVKSMLIVITLLNMTVFYYLVLMNKPEPLKDLTDKNAVMESVKWVKVLSYTIIKGLTAMFLLACFKLPYLLLILPFFIVLLYKLNPKLTERLIHTQGLTEEAIKEYYRQKREEFQKQKDSNSVE